MPSARLDQILSALIGCYRRKPGKDEIVRITADYIGTSVFQTLRQALLSTPRNDVRYYDWGWHLELRSRFWEHLVRGIQRALVTNNMGSEVLAEDLLAHEIGV